ncbi:MAG: hypothetical protein EOO20_07890 [Chryseobacterium sp.]|nr:MAG: hypothetical protein EOO20_07890 [Chryseobacterium sp.]
MIFYNTNGLPSDKPKKDKFWITQGPSDFVLKENDLTSDIESQAIYLRNFLAEKVFGSQQRYYEQLPFAPLWLSQAGIDSDIKISREEFEKLIAKADELTCKFLYYYDVSSLIGSLQNSVQEVRYLMGEFYRELNENSFMLMPKPSEQDTVMFASGLTVTRLFTAVNHIFIALYSQLDFITKICYEMEQMDENYTAYKKLKSAKILFGDARRTSLNGKPDTLFAASVNIKMIQTLRNEIVHNASFEDIQKVFQVFESGVMIEKFILLPDFENGIIKTLKNRKRFFDENIKLNEILPELIFDFWKRLHQTLKILVEDSRQI